MSSQMHQGSVMVSLLLALLALRAFPVLAFIVLSPITCLHLGW